jgi:sugar phosphate isomerase/epimerase
MNALSLQLWTLNENTAKDFAGTVKEVARIGYRAVELAGTGNLKPAEAARALQDAGLKVSSMHMGLEYFSEKFDELVEWTELFQTREVIAPGADPAHFASREACTAFGEKLAGFGAKARAAGLRLCWHNHDKEFAIHDGRSGLEWILEAASPRDLSSQLDLFWVAAAGQDPLRTVRRLGTRIRSVHLKDGVDRKQCDVGAGNINFREILAAFEEAGLDPWYVVEQEEFTSLRLEAVRTAYNHLKTLGLS